MTEEEKLVAYKRAHDRVQELKGFYVHFITYLLVNSGLAIFNYATTPDHLWFYWPLFGWGIGVFFHGFGVFGKNRLFGASWEDRKIKEIMEKEEARKAKQTF